MSYGRKVYPDLMCPACFNFYFQIRGLFSPAQERYAGDCLLALDGGIYRKRPFINDAFYDCPIGFFDVMFFEQGLHPLEWFLVHCKDDRAGGVLVQPVDGLDVWVLKIPAQVRLKAFCAVGQ